ncbi:MAG: amino acid ABC transporter substrate-binding protein [Curvibacter sp.]|nr:amino acid ABC transporter substrate-binding protein [Curvibacter sp.]
MFNSSWPGRQPRRSVAARLAVALLGWVGLLSVGPAGAAGTLDKVRSSGELVIGYRVDAVPFSYSLPGQTQPVGYAIDLCRSFADALRKELKLPALQVRYLAVDNRERFPALVEGRIDLECANTTNTRERREKIGVAFTIPHYIAGTRMMVRADSGIQRLDDLQGKTVVTTRGTTSVGILQQKDRELGLRLQIQECDEDKQCFERLSRKQADAYMMDDILLYSFRAASPTPEAFSVVGKFMSIEPLAVMMRKDDPAFKKVIDTEMLRLIYERELQRLYSRWFEAPIPPQNTNLRVPMSYLQRDFLKFPSDSVAD